MKMTHNIQIGVSVDEESITKAVINGAVAEISKAIYPSGWRKPSYYGFRNEWSSEMTTLVREELEKLLHESRDEIISMVASGITEKLMSSKTFKSKVAAEVNDNA